MAHHTRPSISKRLWRKLCCALGFHKWRPVSKMPIDVCCHCALQIEARATIFENPAPRNHCEEIEAARAEYEISNKLQP